MLWRYKIERSINSSFLDSRKFLERRKLRLLFCSHPIILSRLDHPEVAVSHPTDRFSCTLPRARDHKWKGSDSFKMLWNGHKACEGSASKNSYAQKFQGFFFPLCHCVCSKNQFLSLTIFFKSLILTQTPATLCEIQAPTNPSKSTV